jgi:hypothetical protein
MTERSDAAPSVDSYSPSLRTALVLNGTGTAGAYHAGVLRALHEAGIKLDVVAGRGVGVIGALFAAIDGAQKLWEDRGFWRSRAVRAFYPWCAASRVVIGALVAAVAIVALPLGAMAAGLVVFPIDFVLKIVGLAGAPGLSGAYLRLAQAVFGPTGFPTWLPRLVFLVAAVAGATVAVDGALRGRRRSRGSRWWRMVPAPLSAAGVADRCWEVLWELLRGATGLQQPSSRDLAARYVELLADNLGQPGFRELIILAHDLDARQDLLFVLAGDQRRPERTGRVAPRSQSRRGEVVDLGGVGRDHLVDAIAAALAIPLATEPHGITFSPDAYWRGETHRLCDRQAGLSRLLDELIEYGVEQLVVVSASPESPGPHALAAPPIDGRGRLGESLQSAESASLRDAVRAASARTPRIFVIRPAHNPVGAFDFGGGYDDRSERPLPLDELMGRGYEDAYHQFIEPVVGASGDRVGQAY